MKRETKGLIYQYYVLLLLFMNYILGSNPVVSFDVLCNGNTTKMAVSSNPSMQKITYHQGCDSNVPVPPRKYKQNMYIQQVKTHIYHIWINVIMSHNHSPAQMYFGRFFWKICLNIHHIELVTSFKKTSTNGITTGCPRLFES